MKTTEKATLQKFMPSKISSYTVYTQRYQKTQYLPKNLSQTSRLQNQLEPHTHILTVSIILRLAFSALWVFAMNYIEVATFLQALDSVHNLHM